MARMLSGSAASRGVIQIFEVGFKNSFADSEFDPEDEA
jgi:hypothetical protein